MHVPHEDVVAPATFLHGIGTMLAIPLLDAMVPAASALAQTAARPVRRLGFVYIPMGANWMQWVPSADGRITELSPSLQSLMPFIDQVNVISNLELRNAYTTGNHASANCTFLSCAQASARKAPTTSSESRSTRSRPRRSDARRRSRRSSSAPI